MWAKKIAIAGLVLAALAPSTVLAGNTHGVDWGKVYPYKDLPGVKAPQMAEEKFQCSTRISEVPFGYYGYRHGYPRLVYVCDQNGVISESTRPPNYDYWQYNNRNR